MSNKESVEQELLLRIIQELPHIEATKEVQPLIDLIRRSILVSSKLRPASEEMKKEFDKDVKTLEGILRYVDFLHKEFIAYSGVLAKRLGDIQ